MLSQLIYWFDIVKFSTARRVTREGEDWLIAPRRAWEEEVGLTPDQVRRAEKSLSERESPLIVCRVWRIAGVPTMHMRPLPDAISELLEADQSLWANDHRASGQTPKSDLGKRPSLPINQRIRRGRSRGERHLQDLEAMDRTLDELEAKEPRDEPA